jgi:hypothetical protein
MTPIEQMAHTNSRLRLATLLAALIVIVGYLYQGLS